MNTRCPNCGSAIKTEGAFCAYCGAKLPDNTQKIAVTIEDSAEMTRAETERELGGRKMVLMEQESKLRQKKMKKELRKGRIRWIVPIVLLVWIVALGLWRRIAGPLSGEAVIINGCGILLVVFLWFASFMSSL